MKYLAGILAFAITFVFGVILIGNSRQASSEVEPASVEQEAQIPIAPTSEQRDHDHTVSGGVLNSRASVLPQPAYPKAAKAVRAAGSVSVQITIGKDGAVTSATAVSGHPLLRKACEEAARMASFEPTRLSGHPVKVSGVLVYEFPPAR